MKNPLEQFCEVDERSDGVYIKVLRHQTEAIHTDWVVRAINEAGVMNFDVDKFSDIVKRGRGMFEKVGPDFEYFDKEIELYIQVFINPLKASCKINSSFVIAGKSITVKNLIYYLTKKGVKHGIKHEILQDILENERYDTMIDVAEATPPVPGIDAKVSMKIAVNPEIKPKLRGDGGVDYRNIQTFTSVEKGQLLAVKEPPTKGKPGISVSGDKIPAESGKDVNLPRGKDTEIVEDGNKLIAGKSGIIYLEKGLLHVVEVLHIHSDVDFSVGNVKYSGDIFIKGNVCPGFTVEADGLIHIQGEVEAAKIISRNATVVVEKGILGKKEAKISAKKGIQVMFAQDTQLICEGPIYVRQYLLHCTCVCQSIEATAPNSSIIGGEIKAEKYIQARQIGNESAGSTKLILFDKNKSLLEDKEKELVNLETKLKTESGPIERQLRTKAALLKKRSDEITPRVRDEIKKWVDAFNALNQKISYVQQKIKEIRSALANPAEYNGYIHITGKIYPGTDCELYGVKFPISSMQTAKKYTLVDNTIQCEG